MISDKMKNNFKELDELAEEFIEDNFISNIKWLITSLIWLPIALMFVIAIFPVGYSIKFKRWLVK